jgi:hypothetical protein
LAHIVPQACGRNEDACWQSGEGSFIADSIGERLSFVPDRSSHFTVEPAFEMPLVEYQAALAKTQDDWIVDES